MALCEHSHNQRQGEKGPNQHRQQSPLLWAGRRRKYDENSPARYAQSQALQYASPSTSQAAGHDKDRIQNKERAG